MPKLFHVNWFRVGDDGKLLWPGYGENIRVIDWMCKRIKGEEDVAEKTAIGYLPKKGKWLTVCVAWMKCLFSRLLYSCEFF